MTKKSKLDRSKIFWTVGNGKEVSITNMDSLHISQALLMCEDRVRKIKSSPNLPEKMKDKLLVLNGRTLRGWIEVFAQELHERLESEKD